MNIFAKINTALKTLRAEYAQVKWPSARDTSNLTIFVIVVSVIITLIILGLDGFFYELRSQFIIK